MNERIKELAGQAGGQGAIHPLKYNGTLDVEKFAELIVARCCEIVHRKTDNSIGIVTSIEDYFGVE